MNVYQFFRNLCSNKFVNDFFHDLICLLVRGAIIRKIAAVRISPIPIPDKKWDSSSGINAIFAIRNRLAARISIEPI